MTDQAPLVQKLSADVDASTAAVDANVELRAPYAGKVSAVTYVPKAAVTGTALPDSRTLGVTNKGQAGAGTTVVASLALLSGVNLVAFDENPVTLSVIAGATTVAEGDVLEFTSVHAGAGLADPGGTVIVEVTRS